MHYWDASALVPLCVAEDSSRFLRDLGAKTEMVTWCLSAIEIASAIERRSREGVLADPGRRLALDKLAALREGWVEILAADSVVERALRLLAAHPLRAADSAQLAAALVAVEDRPRGHHFVCNDERLAAAASREGFATITGAGSALA